MKVIIAFSEGKSLSLEVQAQDTVETLKKSIKESTAIREVNQKLKYQGSILENSQRLDSLKIQNDSTVECEEIPFKVLIMRSSDQVSKETEIKDSFTGGDVFKKIKELFGIGDKKQLTSYKRNSIFFASRIGEYEINTNDIIEFSNSFKVLPLISPQEELFCGKCKNAFQDGRFIDCLDCICLKCAEEIAKENAEKKALEIVCPKCKKVTLLKTLAKENIKLLLPPNPKLAEKALFYRNQIGMKYLAEKLEPLCAQAKVQKITCQYVDSKGIHCQGVPA